VSGTFATGGDTGAAANAALRIDEHRLFHKSISRGLARIYADEKSNRISSILNFLGL
jgi:hypothetical protein